MAAEQIFQMWQVHPYQRTFDRMQGQKQAGSTSQKGQSIFANKSQFSANVKIFHILSIFHAIQIIYSILYNSTDAFKLSNLNESYYTFFVMLLLYDCFNTFPKTSAMKVKPRHYHVMPDTPHLSNFRETLLLIFSFSHLLNLYCLHFRTIFSISIFISLFIVFFNKAKKEKNITNMRPSQSSRWTSICRS